MHQQTAYRDFPVADGGAAGERAAVRDVISLPMHAYLDEPTQERIIEAVRGARWLARMQRLRISLAASALPRGR